MCILWRQRTAKSLGSPWLQWGTCESLSSYLFQTSVVPLHSRCSSGLESAVGESFYQGWSFCGDVAFIRQLNHQGLLQEPTFCPDSDPNHSCTEFQVHWKALYSVGTDPSERCPGGQFILCRLERSWLFWILSPRFLRIWGREGGNDRVSGPRILPVVLWIIRLCEGFKYG